MEERFKYHHSSSHRLAIVQEGMWPRPGGEEARAQAQGWQGEGRFMMLNEPLSLSLLHKECATCFFAHSFKKPCVAGIWGNIGCNQTLQSWWQLLKSVFLTATSTVSSPPLYKRAIPTQVALQIERILDVRFWQLPLEALTNIQVANSLREMLLIKLVQIYPRKQTWHRHDTW